MKKITRTLILTLAIILALVPFTGFAQGGEFEPEDPENTTTNGTDGKEIIPVYGYIGKDTNIVDPDPGEPGVAPETEIYIEAPIKILFASFESDAGAITSPKYAITNLSTVNDVKVEVKSFLQREDGVELSGRLALNLVDHDGGELLSGLFPADYTQPKLLKNVLPKRVEGSTDHVLPFAIGGRWNGAFAKELHPVFDLTLQFTVHTPSVD